jgi:triosephosphate isomerase
MRRKIIAANWKMNMTINEAEGFLETFLLEVGDEKRVDIVLVPPFTAIPKVSERLSSVQTVKLGAQNMHWEKPGAYTGEISAHMLRELFVRYVVLGHSERRSYFGETDAIVNKKTKAALAATMTPIVCIGETLAERDAGEVEKVLDTQLRGSLADLKPGTDRGHRSRVRAGLGHRHWPDRDTATGAGGPRLHSQGPDRAERRHHRRQGEDPVRRERETGKHR